MSWFKSSQSNFDWNFIANEIDLQNAVDYSFEKPVLLFKHSTRCSISSLAKNRIERGESDNYSKIYLLDLIKFRAISDEIAKQFNVLHESPQLLKIVKGKCTFHASHQNVSLENVPN
jgi:bacillithiol system protein YtxJ